MTELKFANKLIPAVLSAYRIESIASTVGRRVVKVINGVHVDNIRMAVSYYLKENTGLSVSKISEIVGYKHHSTLCHQIGTIRRYIEVKDSQFFPYWEKIKEIACQINKLKAVA